MQADGITPQGMGLDISAQEVWQYFRDVDSLDPARVVRHYTQDGHFRFANQPPAVGHAAIEQLLGQFYQGIRFMNHRNTGLWLGNNSAVFEAEVEFTRPDGSAVILPAVSVLRRAGDLVTDFRFVMDAAPLTAG